MIRHTNAMKELFLSVVKRAKEKYDFRLENLCVMSNHFHFIINNNAAENAIRPFVLGRKNWMICGSPEGARCSCIFYSLIETAKANGLNGYSYLTTLFRFAPLAKTDKDWERLLPFKKAFDLKEDYSFPLPLGLV
jgi:REP element-mobilizing transposase RayT